MITSTCFTGLKTWHWTTLNPKTKKWTFEMKFGIAFVCFHWFLFKAWTDMKYGVVIVAVVNSLCHLGQLSWGCHLTCEHEQVSNFKSRKMNIFKGITFFIRWVMYKVWCLIAAPAYSHIANTGQHQKIFTHMSYVRKQKYMCKQKHFFNATMCTQEMKYTSRT